ncbi:ACC oxidase 1 [Actinidia rufa]|uniref:ACC oxidase 1 n=1 Tax=Actinidia rufa TaxID=165716 RepID=A0A7J0FIN2_9ERIC|nr:ACC oxidase 1 [Actinidia rufa]
MIRIAWKLCYLKSETFRYEVRVIIFGELDGERSETMALLHWACEKWGCFQPAENLAELMCENLGIEKGYIKRSFSGSKGPSVGTRVAKYPQCPQLELVRGLREHTDAGGIILLLQDDQVPGLEFFKDGQWVENPPSKNTTIFINMGDQVEVLASYISS